MSKLRSYHFDAGNSSKGPVGFCARVLAHTKKEACEILAAALPETYETGINENDERGRIEYFNFYLNSENIKPRLIGEIEDVDTCDKCGAPVDKVIGCPDGAEICQSCFDGGAH